MIKFNSALAFILLFVGVTVGSGILSGLKGYTLGYQALKEVSQPEVKRGQKEVREPSPSRQGQTMIVSEVEILRQVNTIMNRDPEEVTPLDGEKASSNARNDDSFIESP